MGSKLWDKVEYISSNSYKPIAGNKQKESLVWKYQCMQYQSISWHHRPVHSEHNDQHQRSIIVNK
jgi:hypothetical protein